MKYQTNMPTKLVQLMADGKLDYQVCALWDISRDTFYRWINEKSEFKDAYEIGLPKCEAWWTEWGMKGMKGEIKGFSFNAWIAFMNNKFKWAKNTQLEQQGTTNISIGNMNVLNQMSRESLIKDVQSLLEIHKDVINVEAVEIKSSGSE
jgi:hypothetical protein